MLLSWILLKHTVSPISWSTKVLDVFLRFWNVNSTPFQGPCRSATDFKSRSCIGRFGNERTSAVQYLLTYFTNYKKSGALAKYDCVRSHNSNNTRAQKIALHTLHVYVIIKSKVCREREDRSKNVAPYRKVGLVHYSRREVNGESRFHSPIPIHI